LIKNFKVQDKSVDYSNNDYELLRHNYLDYAEFLTEADFKRTFIDQFLCR